MASCNAGAQDGYADVLPWEGGEGGECEEGLEGWRCVAGSGFRVQGSGLNLKWLVQGSGLRTLGPNGWFRAQG